MTPRRSESLLRAACVLSLVALGLIVWSLFDPSPVPVVVAMSIGQGIGTLSFLAFGYVVFDDLRTRLSARAASKRGESNAPLEPPAQ